MTAAQILRELPSDLVILKGSHNSPEQGLCIMEAVAFVAGEKHSDEPQCACPVVGAFLRSWNDSIADDAARTALFAPYVLKLVGSRSTKAVERRRADLAADWLVRSCAAAWLELSPTLAHHGAAFRALPELTSTAAFASALPTLQAAQKDGAATRAATWAAARAATWDAAWAATRAAARAATWAATWDAAWAATRAAARDATWAAARAAARDATWAAARAAAWDAAWAATRAAAMAAAWDAAEPYANYTDVYNAAYAKCADIFKPTTAKLEVSALDLLDRMLAVTPDSLKGKK